MAKSKKGKKFKKKSPKDKWVHISGVGKVLSYRSIFNYPMSIYQIGTFLMEPCPKEFISLKAELDTLVDEKKIVLKGALYSLPGTNIVNWAEKANNSLELRKELEEILLFLGKIPWVQMIGITGSVAAHNANENDDIDVLIVTKANRVWTVRFFVSLFLKILGKYYTANDPSKKICPNIYLDENSLSWDESKRNIYTAHEVVMLVPVVNKENTYFKFLHKNSWVEDYFVHFEDKGYFEQFEPEESKSWIVSKIEKFLRAFQLRYMKKKITSEVIQSGLIHFNKHDHSNDILSKYSNLIKM